MEGGDATLKTAIALRSETAAFEPITR